MAPWLVSVEPRGAMVHSLKVTVQGKVESDERFNTVGDRAFLGTVRVV